MESENRKGIYTGRKKSQKFEGKWDYFFNEGEEADRKYSAFEPLLTLEEMKEGREYTFKVDHKPTGKTGDNGQPTYYHNLGRISRDGDFIMEWTGETQDTSKQSQLPTQAKTEAKQQYTPQPGRKETDSREEYWAKKEARDIEKEAKYTLSLKYINAVAMMPAVGSIIGSMMTNKEGYDYVLKNGFEAFSDHVLSCLEKTAEKRLPDEVAYANRKTDKKEGVEANP